MLRGTHLYVILTWMNGCWPTTSSLALTSLLFFQGCFCPPQDLPSSLRAPLLPPLPANNCTVGPVNQLSRTNIQHHKYSPTTSLCFILYRPIQTITRSLLKLIRQQDLQQMRLLASQCGPQLNVHFQLGFYKYSFKHFKICKILFMTFVGGRVPKIETSTRFAFLPNSKGWLRRRKITDSFCSLWVWKILKKCVICLKQVSRK